MRVLRTKARRDMRRQRASFLAITVTIFLGVTLFGATYDAFRNLDDSYKRAFTQYRFANLTVTGGDVARFAAAARAQPGVEAVQTRTQTDVPIQVGADKFLGRVVGMPPGHQPAVNRLAIESGTYLQPARPDDVLVDRNMAKAFDLETGDRVAVTGAAGAQRVTLLGVASSPEYYWPARSRQEAFTAPKDFGVLYVPQPLAERLAGDARPNQVAIYYANGKENAGLTKRLSAAAERSGATDVFTRADQPSNSSLQQDVKSFEQLAILFPLLFLTAAALATGVLMRRLVTSQRPIVGMLRACGYSRGQIVRHFLSFGLLSGAAGGILGVALGLWLASVMTSAYTDQLSIPLSVIEIRPSTILVGIAFGLGTGALASAAPAAFAAGVPPAEAMRRFSPAKAGKISLAERLFPPLRRLPVRWRMAIRSIGRNPRRATSTVLGVVLALILILSSWGMIDAAQILIDRQYGQIERQDAQLYVRAPLGSAELARIRGVPGVRRAEPAAELPVSLRANGHRYQTALIALRRNTQMHGFYESGGGQIELPVAGLIVGQAVQGRLDLRAGQSVRIGAPGTGVEVSAPLDAVVNEPLGAFAYASLDAVRALAGPRLGEGNSVFVTYAPGVDRDRMRRALSAVPGVTAFVDSKALQEYMNSYLGLYYLFIGIMVLFGGAMAFALLYNSIQANLAERSVEVATLRAAGTPFATLARMITVENTIVAMLGIVPGLFLGYETAKLFLEQFQTDWFSFELEMRTSTFVLASLAILAVALLSELPGLRAVRRLDIAEVVRERAA
ncbi:MAG TPA: ABC transporter permease [Solirubrobacterales bacterium]